MARLLIAFACLACLVLPRATSLAGERAEERTAEVGLGCEGEWADQPLCKERREALDAMAEAEYLLSVLEEVPEPPWNPVDYVAAVNAYEEGKAFYQDEYFGDAAQHLKTAIAGLSGIKDSLDALVEDTLAQGQGMLLGEQYPSARRHFLDVLTWMPGLPEAEQGLDDAETGLEATGSLEEAFALIENDALDEARAVLASVPSGFLTARVRKASALIREKNQRNIEADHISSGYQHLDAGRYQEAMSAFRAALKAVPGSREAREGLAEASRLHVDAELVRLRSLLAGHLQREEWMQARDALTQIITLDSDGVEGEQELARLAHLLQTEERLDEALASMGEPLSKSLRADYRKLIDLVADQEQYGERIYGKKLQLEREFTAWTTPIRLIVRSDSRTNVQIRPGRRLGRFRKEELMVMPGKYVLIGRRQQFREKRITLELAPGDAAKDIEVICDERF